jgi:hypothetical protein
MRRETNNNSSEDKSKVLDDAATRQRDLSEIKRGRFKLRMIDGREGKSSGVYIGEICIAEDLARGRGPDCCGHCRGNSRVDRVRHLRQVMPVTPMDAQKESAE